jgi:hypothetical protein
MMKAPPGKNLQIYTSGRPVFGYPERRPEMRGLFAAAIAIGAWGASPAVRDIDGRVLRPFHPPGAAHLLFFVTHDCPISNFYAPEIQRICSEYAPKGISCALVYVDPLLDAAAVRKHLRDFRYSGIPAILDSGHSLIRATGARGTPEAILIGRDGRIQYAGRIDNFYAALGKPRRQTTVHDLRAALEETLAGKPVTTPRTNPVGCTIPPADLAGSRESTP